MTYETIAQKIKSIPQNHLPEIESFVEYMLYRYSDTESAGGMDYMGNVQNKEPFFNLAGNIHLDQNDVTRWRELSTI
jgi:hypothetical protein